MTKMDTLSLRVLGMFERLDKETLDLHELFEAGGNDPDERKEVFYRVERLVEEGLLEERGNDFYALTAEGKRVARENTESG
jgi:DNA-binding PadR family transcriptional regulator